MDDIVKQAMAKWPNVPSCFGWLGLDARGTWYMRDDRVQALGAFGSGLRASKGSPLVHEKLVDFIQRNYAADEAGRWFFQNGPQRVYVELEVTPWIWRVHTDFSVTSHTGVPTTVLQCLVDEQGWLYLETPMGLGLVHSQDMLLASQALDAAIWQTQPTVRVSLPERYGFVRSPVAMGMLLKT